MLNEELNADDILKKELASIDDVIKNNSVCENIDGFETDKLLIDVSLVKPIIAKLKDEVEKRTLFIDKCGQEIGKLEEELKVAKGNLNMIIEMDERNHKIEVSELKGDITRFVKWIKGIGKFNSLWETDKEVSVADLLEKYKEPKAK